jgi:RNA polymerase sigma-70 factor (ECF subfamily)
MTTRVEAADAREGTSVVSAEWSALYAEHAPALSAFLTKLTGDREVAAELMQETFVRAIRARSEGTALRSSRAWLYRIAANLGRDHLRRRALFRFVPFSGSERGPAGMPDLDTELVHRALRAIPAEQATALLLHYDAGFSRAEIARMEGIGEEAVKSRLARGRERFIREFERLGGERHAR